MKTKQKPLILLDTHIWIWLMEGSPELIGTRVLTHIEKAVEYSGIYVSAISIWEVAMLESKGRINFTLPCIEWVEKALDAPGINLAPLRPDIAVESTRLPGNFHGDPVDRIITATARVLDALLATKDRNILDYGDMGYVKIFNGIK